MCDETEKQQDYDDMRRWQEFRVTGTHAHPCRRRPNSTDRKNLTTRKQRSRSEANGSSFHTLSFTTEKKRESVIKTSVQALTNLAEAAHVTHTPCIPRELRRLQLKLCHHQLGCVNIQANYKHSEQ